MNRPEAKNAMSKKFLNLVSITPVTFTLLIWDDKTFNLRFTQMLETLVYNDQGWWQRAKKMHKNEMASQTVSSLKDLKDRVLKIHQINSYLAEKYHGNQLHFPIHRDLSVG